MGINDFMGAARQGGSRVQRFEKLSKGRTKQETRDLESKLLTPEELPPYTGKAPAPEAKKPLSGRTIKFVFHNDEDMTLFAKHFAVSHHIEASVANPTMLLAILKEMDKGAIVYDKCEKTVRLHPKRSGG